MSARGWIVAALLAAAVLLALVCCVGVLVMRDPFQRLHFVSPPATLSAGLITVAVFLDAPAIQAGLKALFTTLVLALMNAVVTHAIARAARVRARGRWTPAADEDVRLVGSGERVEGSGS